ncbi:hypothetical protein WMY93_023278 [Mugilogobius chulae]|uniref:NR LBD domain-containing protein n=1 Tax=Mugilogobius chulae TaxID=88201 RepID=A0AAW0NEW7_9GOBI
MGALHSELKIRGNGYPVRTKWSRGPDPDRSPDFENPCSYDAFACAGIPQRQLHLRVSFTPSVPLYALGSLHPAFQALSGHENDINLMKACWNELFALGLAQCSNVMNVGTILSAIINHLQTSLQEDKLSPERVKIVMEHIWRMQEFCNSMSKLSPRTHHPGIDNISQIQFFQEQAYTELQDYVTRTYPEDSYRLSKLLLRLPALRLISASVTEELFFAGLIGNVQIDSIIPYILKMESTDYNSQTVSGL